MFVSFDDFSAGLNVRYKFCFNYYFPHYDMKAGLFFQLR